jgi:hypothetical protein
MKNQLNYLGKFATKIFIGIVSIFVFYVFYKEVTVQVMTTFTFLLANICILAGWIIGLYFFDQKTLKISHSEGHGHKKRTKSVVDDNREFIKIFVGLIAFGYFMCAQYVITQTGFSFGILPSLFSALLWIYYFGMFFKEVNTTKIGNIVSQISNQPVREQEEGPITVIPFNQRTTLSEKGEADQEISDQLFPIVVRVALLTKDPVSYDAVFTLWVQWAKKRANEIRTFVGGQQGLIDEVHKYVEAEAQKEAVKYTCRETLDNSETIRKNIEDNLRKVVGNEDEQEPITIARKPMVMKRENDEEIALVSILKSAAIE